MLYIQNTFPFTAAAPPSAFYLFVLYITTQSVSESTRLIPKDKANLFHQTTELWKCITSYEKAINTKQNSTASNENRRNDTGLQLTGLIHNVTSTCQSPPTISSKNTHRHTYIKTHNHLRNLQATGCQTRGIPRCFKGNCTAYFVCKCHWQ